MRHSVVGVFFVVLLTFATGCPNQKFLVRQGAELGTVTALVAIEADEGQANDTKTIALHVQAALGEEGVDPQVIKKLVLEAITQAFVDPQDRLIALTLVDNIAELIIEALNSGGPLDIDTKNEVVVLVRAAAEGVESGATLYLASLDAPAEAKFLGSVSPEATLHTEVIE